MNWLRRIGLALLVIIGGGTIALMLWARSAPRPTMLGIQDGKLMPCPDTPNCVTTQVGNASQVMPALRYIGSADESQARLMQVLAQQPRVTIMSVEPRYVYAEFRTPLIGFIDDVEFLFNDATGQIEFRSASRLGRSDLGVNRARMETIITAYQGQ